MFLFFLFLGLYMSHCAAEEEPLPTPGYIDNAYGTLSQAQKDQLKTVWGFDLEQRRSRLLGLEVENTKPILMVQPLVSPKQMGIMEIPVTRPTPDALGNQFEVNNKMGISQYLYQGDVQLTEDQLQQMENSKQSSKRKKRQVTPNAAAKWPGGVLNYYLDTSINARKRASIEKAIDFLQSKTCLRLVNNPNATNRVNIYSGSGCFSTVGMANGRQDLSLGDGCEAVGTAVHELMHAFGVYHTQMRSDRDDYVTIQLAAVPSAYYGNFAKLSPSGMVQPNYTPYDYSSVMHYSANSFTSPNTNISIIPKDVRYGYSMGNTIVSFYDIDMLNQHYGCYDRCPTATSAKCKNGGVPNPDNCSSCNCPDGYSPPLCDPVPTGCGTVLNATTNWQTAAYTFGNSSDTNIRDSFTFCTHIITAPPGMLIQMQLTNMWNEQCSWGCLWAGIELKTEADQRKSSPRVCCKTFIKKIFHSSLNPAPVISYNRYYYSVFNFQYRYVDKPTVPNSCGNMNTDIICAANQDEGFCNNTDYTYQIRKYNCATTCNLCGQPADPCIDLYAQCTKYLCTLLGAMGAEYYCGKTCGFCLAPN